MGEIADSLISGEFDCITGEYLGETLMQLWRMTQTKPGTEYLKMEYHATV
nr:MAG TPA: hypothetical protein [Caudoviricetes sp.]